MSKLFLFGIFTRGTEMELNNRDKALQEFLLDHYEHFNFWPEEFEHNGIVYGHNWICGQLEKFNFFEEMRN